MAHTVTAMFLKMAICITVLKLTIVAVICLLILKAMKSNTKSIKNWKENELFANI